MSRSANQLSAAIFDRLAGSAADRNVAIPSGDRRVFLSEEEYEILVDSKRVVHFPIARHQAAALLRTAHTDVLIVAGFEAEEFALSDYMRESELSPGLTVAALADLEVEPTASPLRILDIVAAGKKGDVGYDGHDVAQVLSLFPRVRAFEIDQEIDGVGTFGANLLAICAAESTGGNGWITDPLAKELAGLAEQRIHGFPYEFLVMAALELEPRNLFLALYRCLEATYAFTRASELAAKLDIRDRPWFDVAKALGESLSWYPRHDQSLAAVLSLPAVDVSDLEALATSLGRDVEGADLAGKVSAGVRELRNSLVHYGPTTQATFVPEDWNRLCAPLARVVGCVFAHTYGGVGVGSSGSVRQEAVGVDDLHERHPFVSRQLQSIAQFIARRLRALR